MSAIESGAPIDSAAIRAPLSTRSAGIKSSAPFGQPNRALPTFLYSAFGFHENAMIRPMELRLPADCHGYQASLSGVPELISNLPEECQTGPLELGPETV